MSHELKKLIWYCPGLWQAGGGERLLLEGLKYFNANGVAAQLFVESNPPKENALFDGHYNPTILSSGVKPQHSNFLGRIFTKIRYFFLNNRTIKTADPDIVIANSQGEAKKLLLYNTFLNFKKISFVCFIHGTFFQFDDEVEKYAYVFRNNFYQIWNGDQVYKRLIPIKPIQRSFFTRIKDEVNAALNRMAVKKAKAVFVLTDKAKKEVELLYGHTNVQVAHGAFSNDIFDVVLNENKKKKLGIENKFAVLSLCRLVKKKQVSLIVDAFSLFSAKHPNAVLLIGGTGPEREVLEKQVEKLNLKNNVIFLGFVAENELNDYYLSADLFTSADNADYDITSIHALALGKRIVASAQHEFDPVLEDLKLVLHANPTPEGFAKAFNDSMGLSSQTDKEQRKKCLSNYSWESYFSQIQGVIGQVI